MQSRQRDAQVTGINDRRFLKPGGRGTVQPMKFCMKQYIRIFEDLCKTSLILHGSTSRIPCVELSVPSGYSFRRSNLSCLRSLTAG
jgi:hypothetical protein